MIKKIKSSLWLKIFLVLTVLLFSISLLLYGIVMAVMPESYKALVTSNYTEQLSSFVTELESSSLEDATDKIYAFCLEYNATVVLEGGGDRISFCGSNVETENIVQAVTATLHFTDTPEEYTLLISVSEKMINQITQTFLRLLPVIGGVVLAISLIASWFVSRWLTKPILEISHISGQLATLNMTWRCNANRSDEVGTLADNLNIMAARLDAALKELTVANKKLQADIEQERRQEKLRVDFFRAVSHELKTPIAILKGELQGMIYQVGEYKDRDVHLRESMRTVNEMERLVKEILAASRMAGSDFSLTISQIDLSTLVRECCRKWQGTAEDKEQKFLVDIADGCVFCGDAGLLQKAISNIIGNAVKHSPGREEIVISLKNDTLQVINSGVKIQPDCIKHIFEPFYRAEQSHNRETGGSGLGLYVVKTIFERHGLRYCLENTEQGVCFTVLFRNTEK